MNIKINGLCPVCYTKETIVFNEVYYYCANCGLELETPEPIRNRHQYNLNYQKDLERYKQRFKNDK